MFIRNTVKRLLMATAATASLIASVAAAQTSQGNLASVQWLKENLGKPNILLLDASPTRLYAAKHIPGAHSVSFTPKDAVSQGVNVSYGGGVDFFTDTEVAPYPFQERPVPEIEALYQEWGVTPDHTIVVYDQGGTFYATRLFYSFFYHGFPTDKLRILDGGLAKWESSGFDVTTDVPAAPAKGTFKITDVKQAYKADVQEVVAATGDTTKNALLEALGPDWHFGQALNYNRRGHIPYAKMVPAAVFFNDDKTFKSPQDIRNLLDFVGIRDEQTIYTHCGGGIAGSVPFFALKFLANYPNVKHFPESQLGWLHDERELPFWTYDAPYLLRDTDWLQWWGGLRTRTLGSIHVSIVDIRSNAQYADSHQPFALNVTADTFRTLRNDPKALSRALGEAGINPKHEAVIVSGKGLTPDAALAFVTLEQLGQQRVSIFLDSLDTWAGKGYPLRDKPTIVAPKASRNDLAVPPVAYAASPRDDIVLDKAPSASGTFPLVYIASGETLPAKRPDGKIVHVPYTSLLDANGAPKSAAEIWKILADAGVPRFAELVTISDDAGEAAANYVVLKLLGFPGIRVLAS